MSFCRGHGLVFLFVGDMAWNPVTAGRSIAVVVHSDILRMGCPDGGLGVHLGLR